MSILDNVVARVARGWQQKQSRTGHLVSREGLAAPRWTDFNYTARVQTGFRRNAVVYRCVRMIAEACASVPLRVYEGEALLSDHPLITLIAVPNPTQTGAEMLETLYAHLLVHGNGYVEIVGEEAEELYALRPDRMRVVPGAQGWPSQYEYSVNGRTVRFDQTQARPPILHVRLFHPQDDHYGLSPMEAAGMAVDIHNAANAWNKSLFDNAARPSGALVYRGADGSAHLTDEQFDRLKRELEENFQGARNAGRPLLLEGGLDWSSISLTPQDMDFIAAKHSAARDIALAFGVPPMLLGIPGDNTYANYAEANRAFWRQTVLPLTGRVVGALGNRLCGRAGSCLKIAPDFNAVPALAEERRHLWMSLNRTEFITRQEKRLAAGYPAEAPMDGAEE